MIDYQAKYFKYKSKYLKHKNIMSGGNLDNTILDNLETQTKNFVNSLNGTKPIYEYSPEDARQVLNDLQKDSVDKLLSDIEDIEIPYENKKIALRIVKPKDSKNKKLPFVMYFHGGGWILANKFTHDHLIRNLADQAQVAIVFVNYSLSPEAKFPTALEECYHATSYMAKNGVNYNLDTSKIVIAGDSVGGNLSISVTMLSLQRKDFNVAYLVLFYPVTSALMDTESYNIYADGPWLSRKSMEWFWNAYEPDVNQRINNPLMSPLSANVNILKNFPPTLLITDENDVLRDEGEQFAHKLMQIDIDVTAIRYLGTIHDFVMLSPLQNTPATKSAISLVAGNLKRIFEVKK